MKKKPITKSETIGFLIFVLITSIGCFFILKGYAEVKLDDGYIATSYKKAPIYDENFQEVMRLTRGKKVKYNIQEITFNNEKYFRLNYDKNNYYIKTTNIVINKEEVVLEKILYIRTPVTLYKNNTTGDIVSQIKKGEAVEVVGFDKLEKDGSVQMYKIKYQDYVGYVYGKYLVKDKDVSLLNYDEQGLYQIHKNRTDYYGGGSADTLDYYPTDKPNFTYNVMPDEVRSLYLTADSLTNIDSYIKFAKDNNINAFVVDIKDDYQIGYQSIVMEKFTNKTYQHAKYSMTDYQKYIQKLKDNNFYVIGRITVFKDYYYALDHNDQTISLKNGQPFQHNGSYFLSPYQRGVWEYNVKLAKEAILTMGFNEIQFDYVRFPDGLYYEETNDLIDYKNVYTETKAEAIQNFLLYATDELHKIGAYVSVDVFGEAAHPYVTSYGQYWPAISNIVDVISAMPYPDHFSEHQYGISEIVWEVPYKLLNTWGSNYARQRQTEIPTPAKVRTWIQTYDTIREPYIVYDANKISDQISGLYNAGLTGGFITWNGSANLEKYISVKDAFKKEYEK